MSKYRLSQAGGQWPQTNAPLAVAKGACFSARERLRLGSPRYFSGRNGVWLPSAGGYGSLSKIRRRLRISLYTLRKTNSSL